MKINNFSELDTVLKNSFSAVRKEVQLVKKEIDGTQKKFTEQDAARRAELQKRVDSLQKEVKEQKSSLKSDISKEITGLSQTNTKKQETFKSTIQKQYDALKKQYSTERLVTDVKLDTLTKELKNVKGEVKSYADVQEAVVKQLKKEFEKTTNNSADYTNQQMRQVEATIEDVKKDIVKLMTVLREKLVSRESFDKRNEAFELLLRDVLEQTKDLDKAKLSYYARTSLENHLKELDATIKGNASKFSEHADELATLKTTIANLVPQSQVDEINKQLSDLSKKQEELLSQVSGTMLTASTKQDLSIVEDQLKDMRSSVEKSHDDLKQDHRTLTFEIDTIKEWKSQIVSMNSRLDENERRVAKQEAKLDVMQEVNKDAPAKKGVLKAISDFLVEEEEIPEVTTSNPQLEEKTDIVRDVENMLDEKEKEEVYNPPSLTTEKPGFFSRVKTGFVNFFFEEVEEEAKPMEIQSEETKSSEELPVTAQDSVEEEKVKKSSRKKPSQKKTKTEEEPTDKEYMKSRTPRIFKEIDSVEPGSRKKKYKTVTKDSTTAEEPAYYPEDYFY